MKIAKIEEGKKRTHRRICIKQTLENISGKSSNLSAKLLLWKKYKKIKMREKKS